MTQAWPADGDRVKIVDTTHPHFGKTGTVEGTAPYGSSGQVPVVRLDNGVTALITRVSGWVKA